MKPSPVMTVVEAVDASDVKSSQANFSKVVKVSAHREDKRNLFNSVCSSRWKRSCGSCVKHITKSCSRQVVLETKKHTVNWTTC